MRNGIARVELGPPSATHAGEGGGGGAQPPVGDSLVLPAAATESQAWAALGGAGAPVLFLSDAAGAFCSFDARKANDAFDWEMGLALNNTWCCSKSGSVQFDLPERLSSSSRIAAEGGGGGGELCIPRVPGLFPSVLRALELQKARLRFAHAYHRSRICCRGALGGPRAARSLPAPASQSQGKFNVGRCMEVGVGHPSHGRSGCAQALISHGHVWSQECEEDYACFTDCRNKLRAHGVAPGQKCQLPPPPAKVEGHHRH